MLVITTANKKSGHAKGQLKVVVVVAMKGNEWRLVGGMSTNEERSQDIRPSHRLLWTTTIVPISGSGHQHHENQHFDHHSKVSPPHVFDAIID